MADVFISYHEKSAGELAEQIADALQDAGISSWCARRDLPFGGNFAREIPSQIDACRLFLLILTESVYQSEHIENEVGIAFSRRNNKENIQIVPLELGDFTRKEWVQYYLIHTQSVKFPAQPDEQRIQRLVKRIARNLNPPSKPQKTMPAAPSQMQTPPLAKIITYGECGDSVTCALDENGVLIISGNGAMRDFFWDSKTAIRDAPWWNKRDTISLARIENGVTTIGRGAFDECAELISVIIPDSVTSIGNYAFCGCVRLTKLNIPDSVTSIGKCAFRECAGLKSVTIPNSVTSIGNYAFRNCTGMTSVTIPNSVISIGKCAFEYCTELRSVIIPDSVSYIDYNVFLGCRKLTNVSVPARAEINDYAFPDTVQVTRRE